MTGPKFCNRKDYSTYEKVQDIYPDASVIKEVPAGFLVFFSLEDFRIWQQKNLWKRIEGRNRRKGQSTKEEIKLP